MPQQRSARQYTLLLTLASLAPAFLALVNPRPRPIWPTTSSVPSIDMAAVELGDPSGRNKSRGRQSAAAADSADHEAASRSGDPRLQVIVDIDDTVKSSGGVTLAGIPLGGVDTQYQRGDFYPGVFRFLLALSKHNLPEDVPPLNVAVLTARAQELKWALQLKPTDSLCKALVACGVREGYPAWSFEKVMYGSVREWVLQVRHSLVFRSCFPLYVRPYSDTVVCIRVFAIVALHAPRFLLYSSSRLNLNAHACDAKQDLKGWRKYENFKLLRALYPSGQEPESFVFVGDTGELDKECGMRMLTSQSSAHKMKAVFLHVVR